MACKFSTECCPPPSYPPCFQVQGVISRMTESLQNEMHCSTSCSFLFVICVFCTCQSTWVQWLQGSTLQNCILPFALKPFYCSTLASKSFALVLWEADKRVWWEVTHSKSDGTAVSLPRVSLAPAQPHAAAVKKPVISLHLQKVHQGFPSALK